MIKHINYRASQILTFLSDAAKSENLVHPKNNPVYTVHKKIILDPRYNNHTFYTWYPTYAQPSVSSFWWAFKIHHSLLLQYNKHGVKLWTLHYLLQGPKSNSMFTKGCRRLKLAQWPITRLHNQTHWLITNQIKVYRVIDCRYIKNYSDQHMQNTSRPSALLALFQYSLCIYTSALVYIHF